MSELVIRDRVVARVLAIVPAAVVAVCVRVLTLGTPPEAARVAAAGVVALACWTVYRLLTVKVTVGDAGVHVRGVLYDAEVRYAEIADAGVTPASWPVRLAVWGLMHPRAVEVRTSSRRLRPLALISVHDDDEVDRALAAIQARTGAWRIPAQRSSTDTQVPTA